ncbi:hypothetical protein AA13595_0892 [Gluconacetobacter johannae DSM 13595]|uniref:DUF5681 domain-containing protein n=1 Tax=Gluconacetobacter johannae TaxID=112140 RepID=A0A7W4J9F6_9PROT|nr:hypothetical protein [Gluconacetobacter johannae]MBB2177019.1 hypothetical protein [Gluconacetobacter johannae]GBQ82319.1 hypothetical protein AA13595_0892 [Gluconacetobacter johannae DSM 13595]
MVFQPGQSGNPAGLKKGTRRKRTVALEEQMERITATLGHDVASGPQFGAHDVLVAMYRHPEVPLDLKLDAAKAAIRFEKPALSASSVTADVKHTISIADQLARARKRELTIEGATTGQIEAAKTLAIAPSAEAEKA